MGGVISHAYFSNDILFATSIQLHNYFGEYQKIYVFAEILLHIVELFI